MAHFAELDAGGTVLRVIVLGNDMLLNAQGQECEQIGAEFCQTLLGGGRWLQTSYSGAIRKNFAGAGYTYDPARDAFIPPRPAGDQWVLNETTCTWRDPDAEAAAKLTTIGVTRV